MVSNQAASPTGVPEHNGDSEISASPVKLNGVAQRNVDPQRSATTATEGRTKLNGVTVLHGEPHPAAFAAAAAENGTTGSGAAKGVMAVRLLWVDAGGIRRVRAVPSSKYPRACATGLSHPQSLAGFLSYANDVATGAGVSRVGEVRLIPQPSTEVQLPHHPAHSLAITEQHTLPGQPWEICTRAALRRVLQHAKDAYGLELQAGFETEFVLMQPKTGSDGAPANALLALAGHQDVVPFDASTYGHSQSFNAAAHVLDDMVAGLESCDIEVEQFHGESAAGQYEIATGPYEALIAVDKLVVTREVINGVAQGHQLLATFLPKIKPTSSGNGAHVHISLWKDGKNLLEELSIGENPGQSLGASFVAGVLRHSPSLLPFTAPSHYSYQRLAPNSVSGAFNMWGWDNREAAIRVTVPASGRRNINFEFKPIDATCNPYIAMAAIVTAGLLGIQKQLALPTPVTINPATLSPEEVAKHGFKLLPSSLADALNTLKADAEFMDALNARLGPALVKCLIAVREAELDHKPSTTEALFRW